MKPEYELRIFGYIDPIQPPEGSYKAEVFRILEEAADADPDHVDEYVDDFAFAIKRMQEQQQRFFENVLYGDPQGDVNGIFDPRT